MNEFEEGYQLVEEKLGKGKDNIIALATIGKELTSENKPRPIVRSVDAYYEEGIFYIVTYQKSNKMQQISQNQEVSIAGFSEMFTAIGKAENLGWVLEPKNAEIRTKLRVAFASWYDMANNENDHDCCILAIHLIKGTYNHNHWEKLYHMDFVNKTIMENSGIF